MRKLLFIIPTLLLFNACRYDKGEIPTPDLNCVADSVIHVIPVTIQDYSFSPANIEIISGDTVKWTYVSSGADIHTTTCDGTNQSTLPLNGTVWNSGNLNPGDTFKKRITIPGTYTYICLIHGFSMMSGTIVVKPRCN